MGLVTVLGSTSGRFELFIAGSVNLPVALGSTGALTLLTLLRFFSSSSFLDSIFSKASCERGSTLISPSGLVWANPTACDTYGARLLGCPTLCPAAPDGFCVPPDERKTVGTVIDNVQRIAAVISIANRLLLPDCV